VGRNVILVVDDDYEVLRFITTVLSRAGFRVQVAHDGAEGLECYHKHRDDLCLVLSDILMPNMNGLEMAREIQSSDPNAPVLLMSGYSDVVIEAEGRKTFPFIRKPFLGPDLLQAIQSAMAGRTLGTGNASEYA
jgi:DNA-binding NtrC family response regulator